jgi:hypothetical protein
VWGGVVYKAWLDTGPSHQVYLGHVPKIIREPIRGFHDLLKKKPLSVDIIRVFNLNGLPNNAVHISGFHGKDERIVGLNVRWPWSILYSATADLSGCAVNAPLT